MKLKSFFALIVSASMLFAACSESDDDTTDSDDGGSTTTTATGISLDQTSATLDIGGYLTLVATLEPSGADGTITWASSDSSIAAVGESSGTVVGVAAGTASIVASCGSLSATCSVTVNEAGLHASLQGSDYYVVAMDSISYEEIADQVVADFRVDDGNICLYVWAGYEAGTASGVNAYGQAESWTCMSVNATSSGAGWSGLGQWVGALDEVTCLDVLSAITDSPSDYYLHVALKSTVAASHYIKMEDVGSGACVIGNNGSIESREPDYALVSDGEWQHFDIPMTHFTDQGFAFNSAHTGGVNIFIVLSGATDGTPLDYDAVFFYKK